MTRVPLPAPRHAPWRMMIAVGLLITGWTAHRLSQGLAAYEPAAQAALFLGLGAGIFLASFALVITSSRRRATAIEVHDAAFRIVDASGQWVDLPRAAVAAVNRLEGHGTPTRHALVLEKGDGGLVEIASFADAEEAESLAAPLRDALEGVDEAAGARQAEPEAYLEGVRGVRATRAGDTLELRWRAVSPARRLLLLAPLAGLALMIFAFHRHDGSWGTVLSLVLVAAGASWVVGSLLVDLGRGRRVVVGPKHLTIDRSGAPKRTELSVREVWSVDYADQLNLHGRGLAIRTAPGGSAEGGSEPADSVERGTRAMKALADGTAVALGAHLSLPACIAIDLTLGEEVLRRANGRPHAA